MSIEAFRQQIATLAAVIADEPLDATLEDTLNRDFGPESTTFRTLKQSCETGVAEGWLCAREAGGIRYGRAFKPADDLHGFSVDVVDMDEIRGPHHRHPNGEIDLVMPQSGDAKFDGQGAGWKVYPPDTAHHPTVSGGRALVLYLLPGGAIEFTGNA